MNEISDVSIILFVVSGIFFAIAIFVFGITICCVQSVSKTVQKVVFGTWRQRRVVAFIKRQSAVSEMCAKENNRKVITLKILCSNAVKIYNTS